MSHRTTQLIRASSITRHKTLPMTSITRELCTLTVMVSERDADLSTFCPDYLTVYDDWPGLSSGEECRVVIRHSFYIKGS
jgi:hypothetical protein